MLSQTFHYSVASVVSAVIGLLSAIVFTRLLSPEEYGVYVVGLSSAGIVSALRFQSEGGAVDPVAGPKVSDLRTFAGFGIPIALSGIVFAIHAAHLAGAAPAVLALSDDQSVRALFVAEQGRSTDIGGTHNR
jgi:O-antigen/teichoic acid export membrane protein